MSRRTRISGALLVLAVLASACGGDTAGTSTTAPPATTTSTSTTTTTAPAEFEIPETGLLKFRPGITYVARRFWEPVSFTTNEDGWWWSRGATETWVHAEYHKGGQSSWDLDVSVIASDPNSSPGDVVADIVDDELVDLLAEPTPSIVSGYDALVLDVTARPLDTGDPLACDGGPDPVVGNSMFQDYFEGFVLLSDDAGEVLGSFTFGVRSCRAARIWVVDVDGSTITIIAASLADQFEHLIPAAEDLLAGIEFHP